MKIKIGKITEDVLRMTNDIFKTDSPSERLYVDLKNTNRSAAEIDELITANFTGSLTFVDGDKEEVFTGYSVDNIRKSYDGTGEQISIEFKKQKGTGSKIEA